MKRVYCTMLAILLSMAFTTAIAFAQNNPESVTNVHAEQRAETTLFEKAYDASDTTGTVIDIDGNVYQTIKIGDQWWMAENLKVTRYRNGDAIPNVTDNSEWGNLSTGAYSTYDNTASNADTYGYFYNWYAVDDSRNIAPEGWHVPTDEEWKELEMYLGMSRSEADDVGWRGTDEGGKLKEAGTAHWNSPNTGATNESGFTALPGGFRDSGNFYFIGGTAYFWLSTEYDSDGGWYRRLYNTQSDVGRFYVDKRSGFSVRCVREVTATSVDNDEKTLPDDFVLLQNYPNPFNPVTTIKYILQTSSNVTLKIFTLSGQEIETLVHGFQTAGEYEITWQPKGLPSGIYLYRLQVGEFSETKKLILQK